MRKRKKAVRQTSAQKAPGLNAPKTPGTTHVSTRSGRGSGLANLAFVFVLGLAIGGFAGYQIAGTTSRMAAGGGMDTYGRAPGHAHYMHNHP